MRLKLKFTVERVLKNYAPFLIEEDRKKLTKHLVDAIIKETNGIEKNKN